MSEQERNHSLTTNGPNASGCSPPDEDQMAENHGVRGRPLAQAWINEALLADTIAVWTKVYGRLITKEEAMDILTNVRHGAEVLLRAAREAHL